MSAPLGVDYLRRGARLLASCALGRIVHVNAQITNRCNMRCGFCTFPERAVAPRDELTVEQWRSIARKLAREGSALVSIEGGEPLLRDDVTEIVAAFAEEHHPFLYTNGWLVTDALARELYRSGAVQVGVSIDYATAEKHDASRRLSGAHARACEAIARLRDAAPAGARQVHVLTILLDDNLEELDALLELSGRLGVRHMLTLLSTFGIYRSARAQGPPREPLSRRILELKERHPHLRIFKSYVRGIDDFLAGRPPPCSAGEKAMNVDHLGRVAPCIELAGRPVADLVREPWKDVKRKLAQVEEPRTCSRCWTLCRGTSEAMVGRTTLGDVRDFFAEFVT